MQLDVQVGDIMPVGENVNISFPPTVLYQPVHALDHAEEFLPRGIAHKTSYMRIRFLGHHEPRGTGPTKEMRGMVSRVRLGYMGGKGARVGA